MRKVAGNAHGMISWAFLVLQVAEQDIELAAQTLRLRSKSFAICTCEYRKFFQTLNHGEKYLVFRVGDNTMEHGRAVL